MSVLADEQYVLAKQDQAASADQQEVFRPFRGVLFAAGSMGAACVRMPGVVVLGILMVACLCGAGSEAASSGELLLFNNATASIEVTTGLRCTP
jgi:hypothetical protein